MAITIQAPAPGAVLDDRHGERDPATGALTITVRGTAPAGSAVTVNGLAASRDGDAFTVTLTLTKTVTPITATTPGGGRATTTVYRDPGTSPRYRVTIDDNIVFLRQLAEQRPDSLFDHGYLAMLRDLHQRYGTRFALNLFYSDGQGFDLRQMPDSWRDEFTANADWLTLAFHSAQEFPDRIYQDVVPARIATDYDQLATEVRRFAGDAALSPCTVLHWCICPYACLPVLHVRGTRCLSGLFFPDDQGQDDLHYSLPPALCSTAREHGRVYDATLDLLVSCVDLIVNATPLDQIAPTLAPILADPRRNRTIDILSHEQYFYPDYPAYLPDFAERTEQTIQILHQHGYQPVWYHEGCFGAE